MILELTPKNCPVQRYGIFGEQGTYTYQWASGAPVPVITYTAYTQNKHKACRAEVRYNGTDFIAVGLDLQANREYLNEALYRLIWRKHNI